MYKLNYYQEEICKDSTYDNAYYNCLNNEDKKWDNYYAYLKDKYDLCYNVESITIDIDDIKNMKYDCFSNGVLLSLYLMCKKNHVFEKYLQVTIPNNSIYSQELIYNILRSDWLINEESLNKNDDNLKRIENYFKAMIIASEDRQDIKIQFRNKLYSYFLETLKRIETGESIIVQNDKVLKLEMRENKNSTEC